AAPKMGCGMRRHWERRRNRLRHRSWWGRHLACRSINHVLLGAVLLLTAGSAPAATFYLTIAGLGGEPDYTQRFKMWTEDMDGSLKKAGGDSHITTLQAPYRDQIKSYFEGIVPKAKPAD